MNFVPLTEIADVTDADGVITVVRVCILLNADHISAISELVNQPVDRRILRAIAGGARTGILWKCGEQVQYTYVEEYIHAIYSMMLKDQS